MPDARRICEFVPIWNTMQFLLYEIIYDVPLWTALQRVRVIRNKSNCVTYFIVHADEIGCNLHTHAGGASSGKSDITPRRPNPAPTRDVSCYCPAPFRGALSDGQPATGSVECNVQNFKTCGGADCCELTHTERRLAQSLSC